MDYGDLDPESARACADWLYDNGCPTGATKLREAADQIELEIRLEEERLAELERLEHPPLVAMHMANHETYDNGGGSLIAYGYVPIYER